jgi:hypothetical protein
LPPGELEEIERAIDVLAARMWGLPVASADALRRFHEDLPPVEPGDDSG